MEDVRHTTSAVDKPLIAVKLASTTSFVAFFVPSSSTICVCRAMTSAVPRSSSQTGEAKRVNDLDNALSATLPREGIESQPGNRATTGMMACVSAAAAEELRSCRAGSATIVSCERQHLIGAERTGVVLAGVAK